MLTAALSLALSASVATPTPGVAAAPAHTNGSMPVYPRLTAFPDAKVMAKVNAALAAQERTDRASRTDCYAQIRDQKQTIGKDSFSEEVKVTYLSRRFLSVNVVSSYDCAGAYPTDGAEAPLTFDLATGAPLNWRAVFKPGFLPPEAPEETTPRSVLARLYWLRLPKKGLDPDCRELLQNADLFGGAPTPWLIAGRGLAVEPEFKHANAACAVEVDLSASDIAPYVNDPGLLIELATPTPRHSLGAKP